MTYRRLARTTTVIKHHGRFLRQISLWQAVALLLSGTIGAGIFGIPFAVNRLGLGFGSLYIIVMGLLMMSMNLLLGEMAMRAGQPLQLVGLARKFLGWSGETLMAVMMYLLLVGVMTVYLVGIGESLAAIFGGAAFWWTFIFFFCAGFFILRGLRTIKTVECVFVLVLLATIIGVLLISTPHIRFTNWQTLDFSDLFFPYGILLFAFHGATAVPEAYATLRHREKLFPKAIVLAGSITIVVYLLFTAAVIGVTGSETTAMATLGLGAALGRPILILGSILAVVAMGTGFLMSGVALRDSLQWDLDLPPWVAVFLVLMTPLVFFLAGMRTFIGSIDIVGGVFMSMEMLLILIMYWHARGKKGAVRHVARFLPVRFVDILLLLALLLGLLYSLVKLF